jgi:hypothetical protein
VRLVWLLQRLVVIAAIVAEMGSLFGRACWAGNQNNADSGMMFTHPTSQLEPVHAAIYLYFRENDVYSLPALQNGGNILRRCTLNYFVTALSQILGY